VCLYILLYICEMCLYILCCMCVQGFCTFCVVCVCSVSVHFVLYMCAVCLYILYCICVCSFCPVNYLIIDHMISMLAVSETGTKHKLQGGSNMTGTDFCVNKPHLSWSYLNHLILKKSWT
jgi:hypothetical protein